MARPRENPDERFWKFVTPEPNTGCWLWTGGGVYPAFTVDGESYPAHRWILAQKTGDVGNGLEACHRCDTPACVNPDHLFWGTEKDNARDSMTKGRRATGTRNTNARLTASIVSQMKQRYCAGAVTQRALAREYGVSQRAVVMALNGITWKEAP